MTIYERVNRNGCVLECTCIGIGERKWDQLMKGARKANQRRVINIAHSIGLIDDYDARKMRTNPYYNPYNHMVTKTHIIYVHSSIEHFIKVN